MPAVRNVAARAAPWLAVYMSDSESETALSGWREEMRSAHLYRVVAECEAGTPRQALFLELAQAAQDQAEIWKQSARRNGVAAPAGYVPELRTRVVAALVRRFGPRATRSMLAAMKVRGMSLYTHAVPGHPVPRAGMQERRHSGLEGSGNLRAAVFGANDGLVSNLSLILGVAGAGATAENLLLTGVAGLLAGAFSMAAGEYVSVRSQREMLEYQLALEREELAAYPQEEAAELALIYTARGLDAAHARELAQEMLRDPERGLEVLAREELGLNPDELGSPWGAATASFAAFSCGAAVPLLPLIFMRGAATLPAAAGLAAAALFGMGALLSLFTGRNAWLGGARMLAVGGLAGAATYAIGRMLGVAIN